MNEKRDPISEWQSAIASRIGSAVVVLFLLAFVLSLVAPIFGPIIKNELRKSYVMSPNYEEMATRTMRGVWVFLWIWAIICWSILFLANLHPYGT